MLQVFIGIPILHPVNPVHPVILAFHFAVQYVQIIHFREDFTTDGTDYTDRKFFRTACLYP